MRTRMGVALAAACLAAAPATVNAGPPAPGRVALGGRTVVTASGAATLPVRLPSAVSLSGLDDFVSVEQTPNPDVTVSGRGRVTGLVLTRMGPKRTGTEEQATLAVLQYGMCSGAGCTPVDDPVTVLLAYGAGVERTAERVTLPAGDYTLHVVADGGPVTVSLRLSGLRGTARLAARRTDHVTFFEALPATPGRYTGSGTTTFPGLGMIAMGMITRSGQMAHPQGGFCITKVGAARPTDPADARSGCLSRMPGALAGQATGGAPEPFHGGNARQGVTNAGDYPGGTVKLYASFDPGTYRVAQDWSTNPTEYQRAFVGVAVPWR